MNRASLMANLATAIQGAEQHLERDNKGQHDLLSQVETLQLQAARLEIKEWLLEQLLQGEKETLGLFLSGHPLQKYADEIQRFCTGTIASLQSTREKMVTIAGRIANIRTMFTKRGDRMAFIQLEDQTGRLELAIFADTYANAKHLLNKDQIIIVEGEIGIDEYSGGLRLASRKIYSIEQARETFARNILISVQSQSASILPQLTTALSIHKNGSCPVVVQYGNGQAKVELLLGQAWKVRLSDELLHVLRELCGEQNVQICY
jgi:DNA polymerase III subunit alpha